MNLEKYRKITQELKESKTTLVAVSKTKPVEDIQKMYEAGQRIFGENRALELRDKEELLPHDIKWHMIGHLQSNKIKYIAPFVSMIESIDRKSLLKKVNKEAIKNERIIDVLLQVKIAEEDTKYGLDEEEAHILATLIADNTYPGIRCRGVMGMATFTDNKDQVRREFRALKTIFDNLKNKYFADLATFDTISMGMSGDYKIAIEEGSNMVRIGSLLFGARN